MKGYMAIAAVFIIYSVILFFFARSTVPPEEVETIRTDTLRVTEIEVDTFYTPQDTVFAPLPVPSDPDTIEVETETRPPLLRYTRSYADTLIDARFTINVWGTLESWEFDYVPSFPEIVRTETIRETITVTERIRPGGFFSVGGEFRLPFEGASFGVNPLVKYNFSSEQSIFYKYDTDPQALGRHYIGFTYPIRFKIW